VDKSTVGGILLAMGGIIAGLLLEGGNLGQILQPTAAMIVLGGTLGAVLIQFPLSVVILSAKDLSKVFFEKNNDAKDLIEQLIGFANKARKNGIVSLDAETETIKEPFLRKALMLAVDGTEPEQLRKMMEMELDNQSEEEEKVPQVFESAGGFSPTIGIIGAVMGLIQVMQHMDKIEEVGRGIAVAFVATIYGVGAANIFFLPAAGKLKIRVRRDQILSLPAHRRSDTRPPARMIVENKFLHRSRIHFAIFAQEQVHVGFAIGLPRRIQPVHVRLKLHGARDGVPHRRSQKKINRKHHHRQWQRRYVSDIAYAPVFSPARQRKADAPADKCESDHDHDAIHDQPFVRMIQNVMSHLVAHGGFNFRQRTAPQ